MHLHRPMLLCPEPPRLSRACNVAMSHHLRVVEKFPSSSSMHRPFELVTSDTIVLFADARTQALPAAVHAPSTSRAFTGLVLGSIPMLMGVSADDEGKATWFTHVRHVLHLYVCHSHLHSYPHCYVCAFQLVGTCKLVSAGVCFRPRLLFNKAWYWPAGWQNVIW